MRLKSIVIATTVLLGSA
ncbi:predicted protein, partial [Francisella tularensis subsp. holarctica FSC022]